MVVASSPRLISAMHQRLRAAGVAHSGGLQLDLGQSQHPVAIGRVCDDAPLMHSEESQGLAVPDRLVRGLGAAALMIGAHRILLAVNEENDRLVGILTREAQDTRLEVIPVPPRYPMDPDSLICDLAALEEKSVPAAGLDRAMVFSARLLVDLAGALEGRHPLRRVVTVAGQVERPAVLQVPLGTTMAALVEACGGALKPGWVPFLNGLPGGSRVGQNRSVDQDTEGVLILGRDHPLVKRATDPLEDLTARVAAACASCRSCTDVCTAYLRGRELQPHLIMRTIAAAGGQLQPNGAASGNFAAARHCIGCQLCNTICPTLLRPADLVAEAATRGSAPPQEDGPLRLHSERSGRRQAVDRLVQRLGLGVRDSTGPGTPRTMFPAVITIPTRSPMGMKRIPVVSEGDAVAAGDLVALAPTESELKELDCRAPATGTVLTVDPDDGITIRPK